MIEYNCKIQMERKLAHSVLYDIKLCLKELFVSDALD